MKFIIFGYGSIGKRHAANLRALLPDCELVIIDPFLTSPPALSNCTFFADEKLSEAEYLSGLTADAAIIASPTDAHFQAMQWCWSRDIPFLVEKPPVIVEQLEKYRTLTVVAKLLRCAVGFQYRYHAANPVVEGLAREGWLSFSARDNLLYRYGPRVSEIMAAHPLDTALRLLGEAKSVDLETNGRRIVGEVAHVNGVSDYDLDMSATGRTSAVASVQGCVELPPDDNAYVMEMAAWLQWLNSGERDPRLATLEDGLRVVEVLARVRYV